MISPPDEHHKRSVSDEGAVSMHLFDRSLAPEMENPDSGTGTFGLRAAAAAMREKG